nr:unnamed protein product [Spirometra erinaceieuropaei]
MECAILLRLQHPNIVEYKSSFIQDAHLYIEMGFCAGGDLDSYLQSRSGQLLDEIEVLDILVQITMALETYQSRRLWNRTVRGRWTFYFRILDEPLSLANTLTGTPYYMSPELLTGRPYNHKGATEFPRSLVENFAGKNAFSPTKI